MPEGVVIKSVGSLSVPAHAWRIHGGEHLTDCTSGFAVRELEGYDDEGNPIYGDSGITSAGHCDPSQDRGPTQLRFKQGRFGVSEDVQWYTAEDDNYTPDNTVWDGTGHRHVSSTRSRSQQSIGTVVCHYGKVTGHGCGSITPKTYRPQWGGVHFKNTWILVENANVNLAQEGDSGGPWFVGNNAYGTTAFRVGDQAPYDAVYMAVNYMSALDLEILVR